MDQKLSVSQLVNNVKQILEGEFRFLKVEGEISNLSSSSAGHYYLTLSDRDSSISCALFRGDALRNPEVRKLKDGDKVIVTGSIGVYSKRGTFQVIIKTIAPSGKGDLMAQFELLKKKLASEGLFDLENKTPLPKLPKRVAVITAKGAAALQDFLNVFERRSLWMDILLVPSLVQGDQAPKELVNALKRVIKYHLEGNPIDVVVLTRGGGSLEDLWAFNDEALAWEIYNCPIPVISAVGHQVDFSISDFVADFRCETPTAAAEILTTEQIQIKERLRNIKKSLLSESRNFISEIKHRLSEVRPKANIERIWNLFQLYQKRLMACDLRGRLPELTKIHDNQMYLDELFNRLQTHLKDQMMDYKNRVDQSRNLLNALGPYKVMGRGYTFLTHKEGKVISTLKEFKNISTDEDLDLHFSDGHGKVRRL